MRWQRRRCLRGEQSLRSGRAQLLLAIDIAHRVDVNVNVHAHGMKPRWGWLKGGPNTRVHPGTPTVGRTRAAPAPLPPACGRVWLTTTLQNR